MRGRLGGIVCLLSGVALSFAFPEPSIAPLAWVALVPLIYCASTETPRRGALLAFAFGLGFFGALLIWVSAVGYVPWVLLVILQAAILALFGAGVSVIARVGERWALLGIPALWVLVEVVREYFPVFGFPWGQLAQGQVRWPELLDIASLGGGKTVSFSVVLVNCLLVAAWRARGRVRWGAAVAASVLVAWPFLVGLLGTSVSEYPSDAYMEVAIVQGNASPGVQFEDERARVERHVELTASLEGDPDLVVWAESAVGIDPFEDGGVKAAVSGAARSAGVPMIVGANLDDGEDNYLVTTLLVSREGEFVDRYQKTHLVPFGEYVPARPLLGWLPMLDQVPRDAVAADEIKVFDVDGVDVATVISFEGDFGPLVRDRIAAGGRVLVVATNTSTWGRYWASAQHVAMSQVRAAENDVPVVHAALSGISAVIDDEGRVIEDTGLYEEDTVVRSVLVAQTISFYARTGEWFAWTCALVAGLLMFLGYRRGPSTVAP